MDKEDTPGGGVLRRLSGSEMVLSWMWSLWWQERVSRGGWNSLGQRVRALSLQAMPALPQFSFGDSAVSPCIHSGLLSEDGTSWGWESNSVG